MVPSITDNERGRSSIFVSGKPKKTSVGRPDAYSFFFSTPRSFLSLLFTSYWLIYTVEQRSVCRYRCVSDSKATVNCLFLFTTRPLLLIRCPSRVLRPALLPIPELCDDYSIDAIILPCVLLILPPSPPLADLSLEIPMNHTGVILFLSPAGLLFKRAVEAFALPTIDCKQQECKLGIEEW